MRFVPAAAALLLALGLATATAADPAAPATALSRPSLEDLPEDLRHVLTELDKANKDLKDVTVKVTYTREIPLLDSKQKSKGDLVYMAPNLLRLKLGKPRNEEVRTDGKLWWVVSHDDKQVEIYQATSGEQGGQETAFLGFGYGTGAKELLEQYDIKLLSVTPPDADDKDGQTLYRLEFLPVERPDRPARYEMIETVVGDRLWLPELIVLHEEGDEIVHTYALRDVRLNTGVKAESFEYTPPRGYNTVTLEDF